MDKPADVQASDRLKKWTLISGIIAAVLAGALYWQYDRAQDLGKKLRSAEQLTRFKEIELKSNQRALEHMHNRFNANVEERNATAAGRKYKASGAWAWHQWSQPIYHNHPLCTIGDINAKEVFHPGSGGKRLCDECKRLNGD